MEKFYLEQLSNSLNLDLKVWSFLDIFLIVFFQNVEGFLQGFTMRMYFVEVRPLVPVFELKSGNK